VIRLFNVYYPIRTLILLVGEALIVWTSFLLGIALQHREDLYVALNYEGGYLKLLAVTLIVLAFSHWFDLYDPNHFDEKGELYFRLLLVPGILALMLAAVGFVFPRLLVGNNSALVGLVILTGRCSFGEWSMDGWRDDPICGREFTCLEPANVPSGWSMACGRARKWGSKSWAGAAT